MPGRLIAPLMIATIMAATCALLLTSCEPPKIIPRCPGFDEITCAEGHRTLCSVVAADGCQECVCERLWTDTQADTKPGPAADAKPSGEGEGEAESPPDDEPEGDSEAESEGD